MAIESLTEEPEHSPEEDFYVPEDWSVWSNGSNTASNYWVQTTEDYQRVSTLPSLDRPLFLVHSPSTRTYPGIYFLRSGTPNPYMKDLQIDVLMPGSLDYMDEEPAQTEADRVQYEEATALYKRNQTQLESGRGNLYIPDGSVLVRIAEPAKKDDAAPRRIVYVPLPYYYEYQKLQVQAESSQSQAGLDSAA